MGDQIWLYINKEIICDEGKTFKSIRYGPFKILGKIGNNVFQLGLPPYMKICSVVNAENLRLYEPSIIDDHEENIQIPSIEYFTCEYLDDLYEDSILDRGIRTSCRVNMEYLQVGLKGTNTSKSR